MDEIKTIVKENKRDEIQNYLNEIEKENYKTKDYLLKQIIVKNTVNEEVLKIVGEQIIEYEEEIEQKQCLIDEYESIIGDDKLNNELIKKANTKYTEKTDPSKDTYKERAGKRLLKKLNNKLKEIK
jgi:uncharacterized membrane-anchored protein YjiN (DUF445 family)